MFSIIMPLYNKAQSVEKSIRSVLAQTECAFELLIVNDGSTDKSPEIAESITDARIRVIHQNNAGVSAARNHGIREAKFEYLAFIDADDLWTPTFLSSIQSLISQYPNAGAYATAYQFQTGIENRPARIHGLQSNPMLMDDYFAVASRGDLPFHTSGICIPRSVIARVGYFPVDQQQGEDQDLWARIALAFSIAVHPEPCVYYVLSAENRASVQHIPDQELAYSKNLQHKLDRNQVPTELSTSIARYISGHLLHLAQLNVEAGRLNTARSLLTDPRSRTIFHRWVKWWVLSRVSDNKGSERPKIVHLLNDTDMGGIKSVIDSLINSRLAKDFDFRFTKINPKSWRRIAYHAEVIMLHYACNWKTIPGLLMLRVKNPGARIIIQEHHYSEAFEQSVPSESRFRNMLRLNYQLVNQVVAVSKGQSRWIAKSRLIPKNKLATIPQSRDISSFLHVPPKSTATPLVLGAYGRFHPQKGFDLLLKAVAKLPKGRFHLLLAGDGIQNREIRTQAEGMEQVTLCGPITDVPAFLSHCDLVVIPSRFEPFGLVCLEAKAAGKPVLVSDIDGLPEQAEACGLSVPAEDVDALYQALISLPGQPLKLWGKCGREMVSDAWELYLDRWHGLLANLG